MSLKHFFSFTYEILYSKRKERFIREKQINLFIIKIENSSLYKNKAKLYERDAFNLIKKIAFKKENT